MDKKPGVPMGKKVHLIGGDKEQPQVTMQELIPAIVAQLKPTLDLILGNVTALEGRMAVVEEVKQLFPAKVEVTVRNEQPQIISKNLTNYVVKEVLKASIEKEKK